MDGFAMIVQRRFQSTLPVRGATWSLKIRSDGFTFQSTLPVRGATSIDSTGALVNIFQSTLPVRGATYKDSLSVGRRHISIHAPREGSDCLGRRVYWDPLDFNPRSP